MQEDKSEQLSDGWFAIRAGIPTASQFGRIFTTQLKYSSQADQYAEELVDQYFGIFKPRITTPAMQWGIDTEAEAAISYSLQTGLSVRECGLCFCDDHKDWGGTPDRFVESEGLLEIKCPKKETLLKYKKANKLPPVYFGQAYGLLQITQKAWLDFYVYHPELEPFLTRVYLTKEREKKIVNNLRRFTEYRLKLLSERMF